MSLFFFFNDTATTEIYTLSLHDALPISAGTQRSRSGAPGAPGGIRNPGGARTRRSEEHTSELQSPCNLVCRLLLEKKKMLPEMALNSAASSGTNVSATAARPPMNILRMT